VVLVSCSKANEDAIVLQRDLTTSANLARHFTYRQFTPDAAFQIDGTVEDDLRYSMTLSTNDGVPLMQEVVSDDALAVRIIRASFASLISNSLGHPTVDAALRAGTWVLDPAGAPPIIDPNQAAGGPQASDETSGDPFRDARDALRYASNAQSQASGVAKFSLESVTYRPLFDPWRYPTGREVRYDLIRPPLPKAASLGGGTENIGPAIFRKLSVFVKGSRVEETCESVDIEGHEDIVALRQRGVNSNPYLRDLIKRIETKQTSVPITPKIAVVDVDYPSAVSTALPRSAVIGKLDTFESAFLQAFRSGVLKPTPDQAPPRSCNRKHAKTI
jgi:hypothetical protein